MKGSIKFGIAGLLTGIIGLSGGEFLDFSLILIFISVCSLAVGLGSKSIVNREHEDKKLEHMMRHDEHRERKWYSRFGNDSHKTNENYELEKDEWDKINKNNVRTQKFFAMIKDYCTHPDHNKKMRILGIIEDLIDDWTETEKDYDDEEKNLHEELRDEKRFKREIVFEVGKELNEEEKIDGTEKKDIKKVLHKDKEILDDDRDLINKTKKHLHYVERAKHLSWRMKSNLNTIHTSVMHISPERLWKNVHSDLSKMGDTAHEMRIIENKIIQINRDEKSDENEIEDEMKDLFKKEKNLEHDAERDIRDRA